MIYKTFLPSIQLQNYVKWYHLLHFEFKNSPVMPVKSYFPRPEQCLTFDPRGRVMSTNSQTGQSERRASSYLSRQQTASYDLKFDEDYLMLKVVFKPGALFRLLGMPLNELGGCYVDAELLMHHDMERINDQLLHCQQYEDMIAVINKFLEAKLKTVKLSEEPIDVVFRLLCEGQIYPIDWLASNACLSNRQLERKFLERVGVSPKVYNRILRFNKAFTIKEENVDKSWFSIAVDCGYSDLQHLIKDFKQFAKSTPSQLLHEERHGVHRQLNLI